MSRQISFFHAEPDAVRFLQEIDRRGGTFWIGNAAVPPLSMIEAVQDKMSTHLCKFRIVPAGLAAACSASMPEAAIIEFCNCCRGNAMSRTYEVGRLYLVPACSGARHSSLSFRGAKRRGNLAVLGRIIGYFRQKRNCLPEIAASACGLLAMTNLGLKPF